MPESYLLELQSQARNGMSHSDGVSEVAESSGGQDLELGFTGTDNWVLSGSGQYRMYSLADVVERQGWN